MKVFGFKQARQDEIIEAAARKAGLRVNELRCDGSGWRFRLGLHDQHPNEKGYRFQRFGYNGRRRISAVCWHGHRAFFDALFELAPEVKVRTAMAKWNGKAEYERTVLETLEGGNYYGVSMGAAVFCNCEESPL